ncbi:SAV_2336 N-terminal domain-related protein [Streptomyces sp. ICBB 8177]|uniref:SAV_2336 N-terminal domain-related protein n=1 Tax=Streptomyces sp. ICBB 8177 TaxID=563922 RepID=UPI000D67DA86|nr:SAV_2336 N-terminal domain-related protein [Streptomyces sp. ICBB 8177]PWI44078.1 hypothetical protein CK485_18785 [Streptomyces sp. ICBB 8177]
MTPGSDLFAQLVARLRRAGIATDAEGLADALWLSDQMASGDPGDATQGQDSATIGDESPGEASGAGADEPAPRGREEPADGEGDDDGGADDGETGPTVPIHAVRETEPITLDEALQIRVPVANAFPQLLPLERALRPLQRYRPHARARRGSELDEMATAETSARSGHILPVFREVRRRDARLLLVMDDSPSMVVWDQMLEELRLVCEQVGAFRDVAVHYLRPRPDGEPGVAAGRGGDEALSPADRLRDPTGRTVTLLLSDCSGLLWGRGAAQRLLHRWARTGPVAVLQPLPQRMWPRTLLPAEPGVLRGTSGAGGRLEFLPRRRRTRERAPGALAVPVLSPTRGALGAWAHAVSGTTRFTLDAAAAWVHDRHAGAEPPPRRERTAEQLVQDFQAVSSPAAQHLSVYLSAAPLAYPVMQLVQRAMMPQTGPIEMAEVLLSGLLLRQEDTPAETLRREGGPWYDFAPGVEEVLLRRLGLGEATLVLKHCSLYVERVFGRRARNFPAMVVGYLSGEGGPPDPGESGGVPVPRPFAEVPQKVLRRFQPGGVGPAVLDAYGQDPAAVAVPSGGVPFGHQGRVVETARERLARFHERRTIRDLWEAIRLLRTAPDDERQPARTVPLRTLLAECLLSLWEARQGDDAPAEAERTARSAAELADRAAVPDAVAGRAHLVLGRVLRVVAGQSPPHSAGAARALAEADAALTRAEHLLLGAPDDLLAARMCLVDVARERYALTGDRHLLYGAQALLDVVLESWPPDGPMPRGPLSVRGALLSALAEDATQRDATDEARAFALQSVADFETVADADAASGRPGAGATSGQPPERASRVATLLDLAAARAMAAADLGAPEVVEDLERALRCAGDDADLRLECLRRLGLAHAARYARTARVTELAEADDALAAAQRLVATDDPARADLLVDRGRVLVEWAGRGGGLAVATDAVRVLREALAQTPESHPLLAERRLLFGRALRRRNEAGGALTDLHEAEWILARAARAAEDPARADPATAAEAWLERGDVLLGLASDAPERLDAAAESYHRAAGRAASAGDQLLGARAHHCRGTVLERTAGPARALESYRAAWALWQHAGAARGPQARSTLERMRALGDTV